MVACSVFDVMILAVPLIMLGIKGIKAIVKKIKA